MDSTLPFYRQISGKLFLLTLSFTCVLVAASTFYYFKTAQLDSVTSKQLPEIITFNQQKALLLEQLLLIDQILTTQKINALADLYQKSEANLEQISRLFRQNRGALEALMKRHQAQSDNINRLSGNFQRNNQLKESAIIQLTLVLDSLNVQVTIQTRQQRALERQVKSGKLSDKVMAIRAKALSAISIQLNQNQQIKLRLTNTLVLFEHLNLHYNIRMFDLIQHQTNQDITLWLENVVKRRDDGATDRTLITQMRALNDLLFSKFNIFSKWRSQLRIFTEYKSEVEQQKEQLLPLLTKTIIIAQPKPSQIENQLNDWLAPFNIELKSHYIQWLVFAFFILLFLIFITVVYLIKRKLRLLGESSVKAVEGYINSADNKLVPSEEMATIISLMDDLTHPEHSEQEYQKLQQVYLQRLSCLSLHSDSNFWCLPELPLESQKQLMSLLAVDDFSCHWRKHFSADNVKKIIKCARLAKKSHTHQQIEITTVNEIHLFLTIAWDNNSWHGTLGSANKYQQLKDKQQELTKSSEDLIEHSFKQNVLLAESILDRVCPFMLSLQQHSTQCENGTALEYKSISELAAESHRRIFASQLSQRSYRLNPIEANIIKELYSAIFNIKSGFESKDCKISLNIDSNVVGDVNLDVSLFHQMLNELVRLTLKSQKKTLLTIDICTIEKSSAQQILRLDFIFEDSSNMSLIKDIIHSLSLLDNKPKQQLSPMNDFARNIMRLLNITNLECSQTDDSIKLSIDMPMLTHADIMLENDPVTDFESVNILVLATSEPSRNIINSTLEQANAKPEIVKDVSLFQQQLNIKRLNRKKIDIVILSPETYLSDYDSIQQLVQSLPKHLQPKLFVIQPDVNTPMYRTGIFSVSDTPLLPYELNDQINSLLHSDSKSNLLINGSMLAQYRHRKSQVEVLLGVEAPEKNQVLLRLLRWLGLQVTIVSHLKLQEEKWRTGQYLLLISEFSSAVLNVDREATIPRGLFVINSKADEQAQFEKTKELPESWLSGTLPAVLDIASLNKALKPWLKPSKVREINKQKRAKSLPKTNKTDKEQQIKVSEESVTYDGLLDVSFDEEDKSLDEHCFNLIEFAQNQGSVQLAAIMLDDYIDEMGIKLANVNRAFERVDTDTLAKNMEQFIKLTKVIAAKPLEECGLSIVHHINETLLSDGTTVNKKLLESKLLTLNEQYQQLVEFSQAI